MFRNYFKTAIRNLQRNKAYAAINIAGLAVGIAACLLIFVMIRYQTSFDNFHHNRDRTYRVVAAFDSPEGKHYSQGSSFALGRQLRIDYPQLENVARIFQSGGQITVLDDRKAITPKKFAEGKLYFIEPQFFKIFNFPWLAGDANTALSDPNTAVLSQATAEKYFGDWKNAMGKFISYENHRTCKITGILKNMPDNTDFSIQVALSFKANNNDTSSDWVSTFGNLNTFIVMPPSMTVAGFNTNLHEMVKKYKPAEYVKDGYILQPLSEIHFDSRFGTFLGHTFSKDLITALSLIGVFLLLIACINFINLATAQAVNRAKEVGVRKVLGSRKQQLIVQFLSETFLITSASVILALLMAYFALPFLNLLLATQAKPGLDTVMIAFLFATIILVTLLSGFYPALVLSGFNPITALKNKFSTKIKGGISLRRVLVITQFTIAQALIIGTIIIVSQMNYFKNQSMGFEKESILNVQVPNDSISVTKFNSLKNQLLQQPGISQVNFSTFTITDHSHWNSDFRYDNSPKTTDFNADLKWADADVFKTYNLKLVAGRAYFPSDTVREFVVNEKLVQQLGIHNPDQIIGKKINFWDGALVGNVVGVVKDFNSNTLAHPMSPVVMAPWKSVYQNMAVKIRPQLLSQTLPIVEKTWNAAFPDYIYQFQFLDQKIADFYKQEEQLSMLYKIFAGIAIFISCLGLYGLISFMAVQRTKEVGIRKVLGASVSNIVYLFSKEFTLLIIVAFVIAAPIAWFFMNKWLENFAFKISIGIWVFVITMMISVLIAWLTVGYRALRAAVANPVKSLRSE